MFVLILLYEFVHIFHIRIWFPIQIQPYFSFTDELGDDGVADSFEFYANQLTH